MPRAHLIMACHRIWLARSRAFSIKGCYASWFYMASWALKRLKLNSIIIKETASMTAAVNGSRKVVYLWGRVVVGTYWQWQTGLTKSGRELIFESSWCEGSSGKAFHLNYLESLDIVLFSMNRFPATPFKFNEMTSFYAYTAGSIQP